MTLRLEQYLNNEELLEQLIRVDNDIYTTFSYKHIGVDFRNPLIRYARGLTFNNQTGELVLFGFEKFFGQNQLSVGQFGRYNENFVKRYSSLELKDRTYKVYDKVDGSLILIGKDNSANKLVVGSTTQTKGRVVELAKTLIKDEVKLLDFFENNNVTLAFELVGQENRIVVNYEESELILIGAFDKDQLKRLDRKDLESIHSQLADYKLVEEYSMTAKEICDYLKSNMTHEGFVVENSFGKLIKLKTDEYLKLHEEFSKINSLKRFTKNNLKMLIGKYLDGTIDDLVAKVNSLDQDSAKENMQIFLNTINEIMEEVYSIENKYKDVELPKALFKINTSEEYSKEIKSVVSMKLKNKTEFVERALLSILLNKLKS